MTNFYKKIFFRNLNSFLNSHTKYLYYICNKEKETVWLFQSLFAVFRGHPLNKVPLRGETPFESFRFCQEQH